MDVAAIASSLSLLGLIVAGYFVKGLRERIDNLTTLAKEQKETLEAIRSRATELDQLRKDYKQGLEDFQDLGKKIDERRAVLVTELEQANKTKDQELARLKTLQLEELELKKQSLERIPEIEARLATTVDELNRQLAVLSAATGEPNFPRVVSFDDSFARITKHSYVFSPVRLPRATFIDPEERVILYPRTTAPEKDPTS